MSTNHRPLSPHLQIYRWRITMLSSILHRASGAFLCLGLFALVLKLAVMASSGPDGFVFSGMLSDAFWFVWSIALYYHLCNGIRHLLWDAGYGFDVPMAEKSARIVFIATAVLTLLTWMVA